MAKVCIEKKNTPVFLLVNKNYIKFHVPGSSEIMSQRSIFFTLSLGVNSSNLGNQGLGQPFTKPQMLRDGLQEAISACLYKPFLICTRENMYVMLQELYKNC